MSFYCGQCKSMVVVCSHAGSMNYANENVNDFRLNGSDHSSCISELRSLGQEIAKLKSQLTIERSTYQANYSELKAKLKRACDGMRAICFDFLNTTTGELESNKEHYLWKLADELEKEER